MLKNPIPKVTNQLQHRAIGIINGKFIPLSSEQLNRGFIIDNKDEKIETVVLGKALSILKKHIDLKKSYYWIVYPKNKNTQNLHLQVAGIWDPYQLNNFPNDSSKTNFSKLLEELNLKDNYFSVRGELVFVNTQKKEIVISPPQAYLLLHCGISSLKSLSLSTPYELQRKIGRLERIFRVKTETDITFTVLKEWIKKASQIEKSIGNLG